MNPVDEACKLGLEIDHLILKVEVLVSNVTAGLGQAAKVTEERVVLSLKAHVVSTDLRLDELGDEGKLIVVHGGKLDNDRDSSHERRW